MLCACGKQSKDVSVSEESAWINTKIDASRDSVHLPMATRKGFLSEATSLAYGVENDTVRLDHLSRISLAYKRLDDSLGFRKMNLQVLELAEKGKLYKAEGESYWDLASFFKSYGVMDSAYYNYQRAYKSFDKLPADSSSLSLRGRILYSMGGIQDYFKDYLGAEINVTQALRIFEDLNDYKRIYNCNNLLGITAKGLNNSDKSLEYFTKAGTFIDKLEPEVRNIYIWENQNNIASEYLRNRNYSKAEPIYRELLENRDLKYDDPKVYAVGRVSLAYTIFKHNSKYTEAKSLISDAIKLNDSIGLLMDQSRAKRYFAEILAAEGDTLLAKQYALESLESATRTSNNFQHLESLKLLSSLDADKSFAYSKEYFDLNEKIQDEERTKRDKFARLRLETDEVIQRNEALTRGKQIWTIVSIGLLLAAIALYIIFSQRASNNKLKFEQQQQESNQEIYNLMLSQQGKFEEGKKLEKRRISEELHDGVLSEMLGIRLFLGGLNEQSDEAAVAQRAQFLERLQAVEEDIRNISHELSNTSYEKIYNFIVSLEDLVHTIGNTSGIQCSLFHDDDVEWDALDGDIKINAYRIVQESLKNCAKHSQCQNAKVSLTSEDGMLKLHIMDDGVGFEPKKGKSGIGFRNIKSRVEKLGGTFKVESKIGAGTSIHVEIPAKYIQPSDPIILEDQKQTVNS